MGKIRQWFRNWFDRQLELSMQRHANRMFKKDQDEEGSNNRRMWIYRWTPSQAIERSLPRYKYTNRR